MQRTKPPRKIELPEHPTLRRTRCPEPKPYVVGMWLPTDHVTMRRADNGRKVVYLECTCYGYRRLRKVWDDMNRQPMTLAEARCLIQK